MDADGVGPETADAPATSETASGESDSSLVARRSSLDDWTPRERISWFPIPEEENLDPRVADLVRRQREKLGAPNNVVRVHAWRPEHMLRWLDLYEYISKGPSGLSRTEREMIGVVVSAENRCTF